MTKKLEFLAGILMVVLGNAFVYAQESAAKPVDSVPKVVSTRKSIPVPPFQLINRDTITLGEHDKLITDSYTAMGQRYVYDALHSFNRRKMDGFGGFLNDKINAGLAEVRRNGFNSDVKKLYIQVDPSTLTVHWVAVVGPSADGKCYLSVDSRGSAGGGLPAVLKQCPRMHRIHDGLMPEKLLEFNNNVIQCYDWNGIKLDSAYNYINIQQHFYKYYDPQIGSSISLADFVKKENQVGSETVVASATTTASTPAPANATTTTVTTVAAAPAVAAKKTAPAVTYRKYKVKSGDTISEIAEKYHTSAAKIKKVNGLRSDMIQIGQILKIP